MQLSESRLPLRPMSKISKKIKGVLSHKSSSPGLWPMACSDPALCRSLQLFIYMRGALGAWPVACTLPDPLDTPSTPPRPPSGRTTKRRQVAVFVIFVNKCLFFVRPTSCEIPKASVHCWGRAVLGWGCAHTYRSIAKQSIA